jgi:peptidoglycan/LPS O-acetylase OafA/YrhL
VPIDRVEKMGGVTGERLGYRPELDGLRGVAILLVVFAHAVEGVYPRGRGLVPIGSLGGLVGVQLFFVLSGYLITGILLRSERVDLGAFWRRRVGRLYPTLLVVCGVVVVWFGDGASVARAVTYTANIAGGDHGASTMSHAWSLAVEEQFYLVWPVVFVVARRWRAQVCVAGIVACWVAQQTVGWSDHAVYVGLRWDALLAGCLLAVVGCRVPSWCFTAGGIVVAAYTLGLVDLGSWNYPISTLAAVGLVAAVPSSLGVLTHIGRISYALYLWHVVTMRLDLPVPVTLALGWVMAEVTYRLIDRRVQNNRGRASLTHVQDPHEGQPVGRVVADADRPRDGGELRLHRHVAAADVAGLNGVRPREHIEATVRRS